MAEKEIILQGEDVQVDELVLTTQDQASCNSLEDCVRMLFPQEGETAPRLRFKGFDGKWEKRLLSDCLEISEEKNTDNVFGVEDVLSVSDDYGVVNQIEHLGRSYAGKSVSGYKILRPGQIVYTKSPLRAKPYGIVKVNRGKVGIVSVLYAVYNTKEGVAPEYIHYYFDPAWRLNAYMRPLVNKGAKNTMNISDETALTGYIMIPKDIDEQRKIASFLQRLDEQVKHYQEQFDELKHLKSACLNEMFPKQNESIPSVRFSGFEGDWEIVSFKDITRLAGVRNRENLPLESYSISNENGFVPQNEQFENGGTMSKADKRLYYIVSPDSFAYNPARINVGSIGYDDLDKDVIVSSLYVVFKTDEKTYNPFLNYWFKTPTFRKLIEQYQEGGVRLYFFYDKLCKCSFRRPSFDEQRQIATFFSELDKQISAQQEQLERLKQMKQSCLGLLFADNQSITPPHQIQGI